TNQRPTTGNYPSSKTARPRYRTGALKEENQRFHQVKQNQNTLDTAGVVRDDTLPRGRILGHRVSGGRGRATPRNCGFRGRMPASFRKKSYLGMETMANQEKTVGKRMVEAALLALLAAGSIPAVAQQVAPRDPAEPAQGKPQPKILARPAGRVARASVDEKSMRTLIGKLVACGTRLTLSSWDDPKRGIGCGRDA